MRGNKFRQHHGGILARRCAHDQSVPEIQQRAKRGSIRRGHHDQRHIRRPRFPLAAHLFGSGGIHLHIHRGYVVGDRSGIAQCFQYAAMYARDRHHDARRDQRLQRRRQTAQRQFARHFLIMTAHRFKSHDDQRDQQRHDPGALAELAHPHDEQRHQCRQHPQSVDQRFGLPGCGHAV